MNLLFLILEHVLALQAIAASLSCNGCRGSPRKQNHIHGAAQISRHLAVRHRKIHAASRNELTRRREIHASSQDSRGISIKEASQNSHGISIKEASKNSRRIAKSTRHREICAAKQANAVRRKRCAKAALRNADIIIPFA